MLTFPTMLGACTLSWEGEVVTGFRLPGPPDEILATVASRPNSETEEPPPWVTSLVKAVQRHLEGKLEDFAGVPFAFARVTSFEKDVYCATLAIKAGDTRSYGQLARALGLPPAASRAVGAALGRNPWPLLVPCHRLVGADGHMTGFSAPGGTATKLRLLALEGSQWFAV
jgi:methylated-DNA-[protein]-cysteine S-methyltransferase